MFGDDSTRVPTCWVGPVKIKGQYANGEFYVPLATAEKALVPSVSRGCKAIFNNGIETILKDYGWSRAPVLEARSTKRLTELEDYIINNYNELKAAADSTTNYGSVKGVEPKIVGRNMYLRINMSSGDAGGHNITTKASYALVSKILENFPDVKLISLSGNYCADKKVSAVNSIAGRGKYVIAETIVSAEDCKSILKTTPEAIVKINNIKNYQGSIVAGSICSANAHYANILAAMYLATGQDVANIVEGSQGITGADIIDNNLYFAVTLPNIIVGTIGGGTYLEDQSKALEKLECKGAGNPVSSNAKKLAEIIAATVLVGELNLLAVLSNNDELVMAHEKFERNKAKIN